MVTHGDRLAFAESFVTAAEHIAATTKDEEALRYWKYLQEHGFIAGLECAEGVDVTMIALCILDKSLFTQREPKVPIVPLYPEDIQLGPAFKSFWECSASGMHCTDNNVIWLKADCRENDFGKGCTLLHEAGHAYRTVAEGRLGTFAEQKIDWPGLLEEGDLHYMVSRLWKERGGAVYAEILDEATCLVQKRFGTQPGFYRPPWCEQWSTVLNAMLGPTQTLEDANDRKWTFAVHAHFEMIDGSRVDDKRNHRATVINLLYEKVGHRQ